MTQLRRSITAAALLLTALLAPLAAHAADAPSAPLQRASGLGAPTKSGYVEVNGVDYYYQIRGKGQPLLLLHGGLGQIEMFGPALTRLTRTRQVIGVDLHGHGRTSLGARPIRYTDMADDLSEILRRLKIGPVDVLGYSMGGAVALRLAVQHPERVKRLVIASAVFSRDGSFPELLQMQAQVGAPIAEAMKDTPMYKSYAAVAPRPQDFPLLLDRMGELMRTPFDWSEDVRKLAMPVMLIYPDSDMIRLEHVVQYFQLLGGGLRDAGWARENMPKNRLAILPNFTHYDLFLSPELATTALSFLDPPAASVPSWSEQVRTKR